MAALRDTVAVYCVGPVTAAPLTAAGVPSLWPERMRLGALARLVAEDLPTRRPDLAVAGHQLALRASSVLVDGAPRDVGTAGRRLLEVLVGDDPGAVVSRADLLSVLGSADEHAVETAIARLRAALGHRDLIETVVKRGYRLAVDGR